MVARIAFIAEGLTAGLKPPNSELSRKRRTRRGRKQYLYTKHPEAKSLAPDGSPCTCETRGLLQRSSVIATSRRYVGKETDRRWEQGEDLSLLEFKAVEYQGSKQVVASDEIKEQILKTGIRKVERETGVSHHTIDRVLKGKSVRRKTLGKIVRNLSFSAERVGRIL